MPAVSASRKLLSAPAPVDGDRVARDPGLRPGQHPLLAEQAVDQRRFAGIRLADDGDVERLRRVAASRPPASPLPTRPRHGRADRVVDVGDAEPMLGRRPRPARRSRANRPPGCRCRRRGSPSCWRRARPASARGAQELRRNARRSGVTPARASITKSTRSASADRRFGLPAHAPRRATPAPASSSPAVSISAEAQVADLGLRLAPVARDARQIVDERQPLARPAG